MMLSRVPTALFHHFFMPPSLGNEQRCRICRLSLVKCLMLPAVNKPRKFKGNNHKVYKAKLANKSFSNLYLKPWYNMVGDVHREYWWSISRHVNVELHYSFIKILQLGFSMRFNGRHSVRKSEQGTGEE